MAIPKIIGAQRDFSGGELDLSMKRADENPIMKIGCRQLSNWRVLHGGAVKNRPGRRALFPEAGRVEEVLMSPGNVFYLVFGAGYLRVYNAAGTQVFNSTNLGDGSTAIPWTSTTIHNVSFAAAAGAALAIYIAFADGFPTNRPQVLTWDGISQTSTWTLATYSETITPSGQKRTIFDRISPQDVTLLPSATTGNINITMSSAILVLGMVETRLTYCGRQVVITGVTLSDFTTATAGPSQYGTASVVEPLPPSQTFTVSTSQGAINIGDEVVGSVTGAKGIIVSNTNTQQLQLSSSITGAAPVAGDSVSQVSSGATGIITGAYLYPATNYCSITIFLSTLTPFVTHQPVVWTGNSSGNAAFTFATTALLVAQLLPSSSNSIIQFSTSDEIAGPSGNVTVSSASVTVPNAVSIWDDEVMNLYRGYPSSVFYDQSRLGFCNFPVRPSGIAWGTISLPQDIFVSALDDTVTSSSAIFELSPGKSQVLFVQPGMESSEFVFCDNAIYYIPITTQNPLKPGSVAFNLLSSDGCAPNVRPKPIQQSILYMKAGLARVGAVQAPGAYYRPYVVDDVSQGHEHLFTGSNAIAIAAPSAPGQFEESYAYILLANGNIVMAQYSIRQGLIDVGPEGKPKMGWLPWNGAGVVTWLSAQAADVIFTTTYQPTGAAAVSIAEILDNTQYLDGAIFVTAPPTPFVTAGKGPLYFLAGGQVTLIDNGTRMMGTYNIDVNGNIIPQFNGGENLSSATLVAGQPWTSVLEPFVPDAPPGPSQHQRMFKRRVSRMAVYVSNSTGFLMARLFSGPITPATAAAGLALGTVMNTFRVTTWNIGDNVEAAPPLREEAYRWRPLGRSYDPRMAVIKDVPGPLIVHEIGLEASL
jgi:hypothetical protein